MKIHKKLIEVSIPLEAINKASAREKSIRHGHPSTLHLWWARRPLAACRAVLFAQLVDDPSAWPDRFPSEEEQAVERRRLHKIIEEIVPWEASNDEAKLNAARFEIARSVAWGLGEEPPARDDPKAILDYLQTKAPPVYDPFCGGGSIPLEAQRLGLRAYGSDLNPVAVLISKALVEIPPKFAGLPPVNPQSRAEIARGGRWNGKGAQGLAEDVRYYGKWMRDEAQRRIGHLYPKAKLPDGSEATVIAWLWARTVRSPDPAAKGAMVPLVSSFMLSTKEGRKVWVEPVIDGSSLDGWRFEVGMGLLSKGDEERLKKGTKTARGANFACVLTGSSIDGDYIKAEGVQGRLSARLMAIVCEGNRGRLYVSANSAHQSAAHECFEADASEVSRKLGGDLRAIWCPLYGLDSFDKLFTKRQLNAVLTVSDLVNDVKAKVDLDVQRLEDLTYLHESYTDAIATYLAFMVSAVADDLSSLVSWRSGHGTGATRATFARQGLPMIWDFAEANPFAGAAGDIRSASEAVAKAIECVPGSGAAIIRQLNAIDLEPRWRSMISTDPPYYDNIGYADLSDFFYVWLKRSLGTAWPELFRRIVTPKDEELIAAPYRHGSKDVAEAFFMRGMVDAIGAVREAATSIEPLSIYYAFKQSEAVGDGITSAGWASFLQAVVDSALVVDGTWPIRTERSARSVGIGANALASSIVLVCRKRPPGAVVVTRTEFIRALKRELPDAIDAIRKAGVGPVDMQQSVIGPGMGVFTRFAKVLEDDDSAMSVRTALALINRVWEEIESDLDAAFDAESQVALAWFATYGFDAKPSGELITLANAKNVPLGRLFASGVFADGRGRAGLTARADLPLGWTPASDRSPTIWECVQHTARVLSAEDGGGEAAARLVAEMGPQADAARALAYRLYEISSQKGWQQEALVYNELAQEWPKLEDRALMQQALRETAAATQGRLL